MKIGRNQQHKYPQEFSLPTDRDVQALLALAGELGINLLDTAPAYGSSEQRLGKLLDRRENWILCSKAGEEFDDGQSRFDFSGSAVQTSVERSLRRLKTDYLDIVLVHSDGNDVAIISNTDCFATLDRLKDKGMIRALGMSSKTVDGGLLALEVSDVVMVTCNPGALDDLPVIARAAELDKGVLIKKALASGHLSADPGADPVYQNMEFVLSRPGVDSVIVGTLNPKHLRHDVDCAIRVLEARR